MIQISERFGDDKWIITSLAMTFLFVAFLFFIDEGHYNMHWMNNLGAWIVFVMYCLIIWTIQLLVQLTYTYKLPFTKSQFMNVIIAFPVALVLIFFIF
ncbi:MAG TPA: hypothetical protein PK147_03615 [Saprospiraceae bacterium]|nr:hypothetical protein [Saprospiraceae bacterium]HPK10681.1 hypothetical protein [Saprospiraceae bacterium]HPQ20910.1 hypothetical protein [Saprospiraceae bacterium]HRX29792.1 hypothetical protein [Saprospiraceae bacterium]